MIDRNVCKNMALSRRKCDKNNVNIIFHNIFFPNVFDMPNYEFGWNFQIQISISGEF